MGTNQCCGAAPKTNMPNTKSSKRFKGIKRDPVNIESLVTNQPVAEHATGSGVPASDTYQDITEEKAHEKYSAKYQRPRNTPELLLEIMHDYDEIKTAYLVATDVEKANLDRRLESDKQLSHFFADMGSAYGAIGFLDPTEKADFAEVICNFMDNIRSYDI